MLARPLRNPRGCHRSPFPFGAGKTASAMTSVPVVTRCEQNVPIAHDIVVGDCVHPIVVQSPLCPIPECPSERRADDLSEEAEGDDPSWCEIAGRWPVAPYAAPILFLKLLAKQVAVDFGGEWRTFPEIQIVSVIKTNGTVERVL